MKKVLIVDDDEGILDALTAILEFEGYSINSVSKASATQVTAEQEKPDIILLDLLLGDTPGTSIAHTLKHTKSTSSIPIVMLSAHPNAEAQAKGCGADGFIAKPFDIDKLLEKIKDLTTS